MSIVHLGFNFSILSVTTQQAAVKDLITPSTMLNMLLRTIGQTLLAAIYGLIFNSFVDSQLSGNTAGISLKLVNTLNSSKTIAQTDPTILESARQIVFGGIHTIFLLVLIMIIGGLIINRFAWTTRFLKGEMNHD
ncbi:hypothetical protein ACFQ5M_02435 [Agrilactobacillus yilanensis]|uniref:MFS transporter n=1 Tax=Agrilactobacillus yilanensis TaxID=2485997 RepID=A0ABW4J3K8_9LACO|nr:hypothetical protein [Agrilactobacillus yilanensis]